LVQLLYLPEMLSPCCGDASGKNFEDNRVFR